MGQKLGKWDKPTNTSNNWKSFQSVINCKTNGKILQISIESILKTKYETTFLLNISNELKIWEKTQKPWDYWGLAMPEILDSNSFSQTNAYKKCLKGLNAKKAKEMILNINNHLSYDIRL